MSELWGKMRRSGREENDVELNGDEARQFRGTAARGNYLGSDRVDIQYAVKEICRGMAKPTKGDQRSVDIWSSVRGWCGNSTGKGGRRR